MCGEKLEDRAVVLGVILYGTVGRVGGSIR